MSFLFENMEFLTLKDTVSKYLRGKTPFRRKTGKAKSSIGKKIHVEKNSLIRICAEIVLDI
jgi:hypothetical protein